MARDAIGLMFLVVVTSKNALWQARNAFLQHLSCCERLDIMHTKKTESELILEAEITQKFCSFVLFLEKVRKIWKQEREQKKRF